MLAVAIASASKYLRFHKNRSIINGNSQLASVLVLSALAAVALSNVVVLDDSNFDSVSHVLMIREYFILRSDVKFSDNNYSPFPLTPHRLSTATRTSSSSSLPPGVATVRAPPSPHCFPSLRARQVDGPSLRRGWRRLCPVRRSSGDCRGMQFTMRAS